MGYTNLFSQKKLNSLPSTREVNRNLSDNNISDTNSSKYDSSENATNILFLDNKSDSMVVASVDSTNKNIKLTPVTNTGYFDRSNMDDLLNNIEQNVNINLDKFLQIDTSELTRIISVLEPISVNIKSEDLKLINNLIPKFYAELNDKTKGEMKLITSPGEQSINEYQAMAYLSVVAKDSNSQKEAILSLVKNMKNLGFSKYIEIYNKVKPYIVETNLTIPDMLKFASSNYEFK